MRSRCQNQNQISQSVIGSPTNSPSQPSSAISVSSPTRSRINSTTERLSVLPLPVTSLSSKNHQNGNSVNILPSSPSQIHTPRTSSAKTVDNVVILPPSLSNDVGKQSEPRVRRILQRRMSNNSVSQQKQNDDEHEVNRSFLAKLKENDTLNRRRRDHTQLNDHAKQEKLKNHLRNSKQIYGGKSQESDQEYTPVIHDQIFRKSSSLACAGQLSDNVIVRKQDELESYSNKDNGLRQRCEADHCMSNGENSNHSSYSIDDSLSQTNSSFDSNHDYHPNESARIRRRKKLYSSSNIQANHSGSSSTIASLLLNANETINNHHSNDVNFYSEKEFSSKENVDIEVEKKNDGEKDMNCLLFMLTATLKLPTSIATICRSQSVDDNESINSSSSVNNSTIVDDDEIDVKASIVMNGRHLIPSDKVLLADRTMYYPFGDTSKFSQRRDALRQNCLSEISSFNLRRLLDIIDRVGEVELKREMTDIIGNELYEKYCLQIFTLKFYEDTLHCH
ncbi:unnamed protein product [Didymodactylos carnosus]|uniref:Uncharacterized protein n=1 Tax=Didymodactylos carnosus TaxID=1234261 RepID=A0A814RFR7_9BILA|nr:unnamed protein product [Didymodactylos carnosus]CAF3895498.1 unnamed protein product [Didymodactylos carnosus]